MEQTVGSYEEEKAAYLSRRQAVENAHVGQMQKLFHDHKAACQKMIEDKLAQIDKIESDWDRFCQQKGWQA